MKAIVLDIKTKQPVLATSFQGDPNSDVSYGYIPGSVIRGALIGRYLKRNAIPRNADIVSDPKIRSLFFDNTTRYLNAYLYDDQHRCRTLPSPLSWHKDKRSSFADAGVATDGIEIYDLSQKPISELNAEIAPRKVSEPFCSVRGKNVWLFREGRRVNVHNQRDRRKGRAVEGIGKGEVFRYDALESGQTFQTTVLCDRDEEVEIIQDLLDQIDLWVGGSQTAGYGHCQIKQLALKEGWTEVGIPIKDRCDRDLLTVHLLSDLILRDTNGQYVVAPPTGLLEEALGIELNLKTSFLANEYVGGFNRKWGLPLPQVQVTSAGSVFVYEPKSQVEPEALRVLEEKGIGERCLDGFGRIAFNWLEDDCEIFRAWQPNKHQPNSPPTLQATSSNLASTMATRLLRQRLDRYLLGEVHRYPLTNPPTNSQLSRIMLTAQQALMQLQQGPPSESSDEILETGSQAFTRLFSNLPKNATRQLESARVPVPFESQPISIAQAIKGWLESPDRWLTHPPNAEIAGANPDITPLLKQEYTLRLIMAVAKKVMKENPDD
jgi:CRISPR-associated protein Csx10